MVLADQPPERIAEWVMLATAELDKMALGSEAVVLGAVSSTDRPPSANELRAQADRMDAAVQASIEQGVGTDQERTIVTEAAADLRRQAESLVAEAEVEVDAGKTSDAGTPEQHRRLAESLRERARQCDDEGEEAEFLAMADHHEAEANGREAQSVEP
jgi:hypothetical protein